VSLLANLKSFFVISLSYKQTHVIVPFGHCVSVCHMPSAMFWLTTYGQYKILNYIDRHDHNGRLSTKWPDIYEKTDGLYSRLQARDFYLRRCKWLPATVKFPRDKPSGNVSVL